MADCLAKFRKKVVKYIFKFGRTNVTNSVRPTPTVVLPVLAKSHRHNFQGMEEDDKRSMVTNLAPRSQKFWSSETTNKLHFGHTQYYVRHKLSHWDRRFYDIGKSRLLYSTVLDFLILSTWPVQEKEWIERSHYWQHAGIARKSHESFKHRIIFDSAKSQWHLLHVVRIFSDRPWFFANEESNQNEIFTKTLSNTRNKKVRKRKKVQIQKLFPSGS